MARILSAKILLDAHDPGDCQILTDIGHNEPFRLGDQVFQMLRYQTRTDGVIVEAKVVD